MTFNEKVNLLCEFCENRDFCANCPLHELGLCNDDTSFLDLDENTVDAMLKAVGLLETGETPSENDVVNHPNHYTNGGMECIDEMILLFGKEVVKHFCLCNAWKYRRRALYKNGEEDIKKSHWYIAKYKELCDGQGTETL